MQRTLTALAAGALTMTAACSGGSSDEADRKEAPEIVRGHASYAFPFDTLEDWVSYGDAVVVATVTDEERIPPGPEDAEGVERGEGVLIGRDLTVEVDEVLWRHSSVAAVPETLTFTASGWVLVEGEEVPYAHDDEARMEVGNRYVVPLRVRAETGALGAIQRGVLPTASNGRVDADIESGSGVAEGEPPPAEGELAGLTPDEVAAELAETSPNLVAEAHRDLAPPERYQAVLAAEQPAPPGG